MYEVEKKKREYISCFNLRVGGGDSSVYALFTEITQVVTDLYATGKTLNFLLPVTHHGIITRIIMFPDHYKYLCLGFGKEILFPIQQFPL